MYEKYFGLREQPFGVTPDPRFLYLSAAHREALASLYYGIEANRGFLGLIAKPGMGKTTILFHLLEKFRSSARTAFLFQTQCTSREFMRFLLAELGYESDGHDFVRMHEEFNRRLLQEARAGNRFIVVIDEAQNLEPSVLETVRLLSDFETPRAKLMHIILAGQPELADKLASPGLSQLRQRVSIVHGLEPLSAGEIKNYIEHRLRIAGYEGEPLFTPEVYDDIARFTEGIPQKHQQLLFQCAFAHLRPTEEGRRLRRGERSDRRPRHFETHLGRSFRLRRRNAIPRKPPTVRRSEWTKQSRDFKPRRSRRVHAAGGDEAQELAGFSG